MHDVENHTSCYLRDLLNTRAHHDPEITTFLTLWNHEELWHGEAVAERIDRRVDALPGLAGLDLMAGALARYG